MERIQHSRKRGAVGWVVLLILVLALAGAAALYVMERSQLDDLKAHNQALRTMVQELEGDLAKQQSTQPSTETTYTSQKGTAIMVYTPKSGETVGSPLGIVGKVPGSWLFEASFPVQLKDGNGKVIAKATAQVAGEWMTENDVPFAVTLTFDTPKTKSGTLVLQKDNPSGLAKNDDSVSIPVTFRE